LHEKKGECTWNPRAKSYRQKAREVRKYRNQRKRRYRPIPRGNNLRERGTVTNNKKMRGDVGQRKKATKNRTGARPGEGGGVRSFT